MNNSFRLMAVAVLMMSAVAVFAQEYGRYDVRGEKVYYDNVEMRDADPWTIRDLGHGYAKDAFRVYWKGHVLPYVDPACFRLTDGRAERPHMPGRPADKPGRPGVHGGRHGDCRYLIARNDVLFDGKVVRGANVFSFKDLGWGYGKDSFSVFYYGVEVKGAVASSFEVLDNGYAQDAFNTYYHGKKVNR